MRIELGDRNDTYVPAPPPALAPGDFVLEVDGGAGNDTVTNGPGPTWTTGGAGNDSIFARNGHAEFVMCGDGVDRVRSVDPDDDAWTDCESVAAP